MIRKVCWGIHYLLHCSINSRTAELNQSSDTCCHIFVKAAVSSVFCRVTMKEFLEVFQEKPRSLWGHVIFSYVNAGFVRSLKPHICLSEVTASSWDSDYGLQINVFMFHWRSPVVWGRYSSTTLHATAPSKDSPVFFLQLFFLHVFFGLIFNLITLHFLLKSFWEPFVTSLYLFLLVYWNYFCLSLTDRTFEVVFPAEQRWGRLRENIFTSGFSLKCWGWTAERKGCLWHAFVHKVCLFVLFWTDFCVITLWSDSQQSKPSSRSDNSCVDSKHFQFCFYFFLLTEIVRIRLLSTKATVAKMDGIKMLDSCWISC